MRAVILTMATFGLVGCLGQLDSPGTGVGTGTNPNPTGGDSQARKLFETNVYPIIKNSGQASDCSSCHDSQTPSGNITGFVAGTVGEAYATATSFQTVVGAFTPSTAGILTRITTASDVHVTQRGRVFTAAQIQSITDWLAQEAIERAGGTGGGGTTGESAAAATSRVMNEFSACMNITDFNTANMATAWNNMNANGSACHDCHATGGYGMIVTGIATGTAPPGLFTTIDTNKYYMIQYFTVDLTGGPAMAKVMINHTSFDGVSKGIAPHAEHPRFDSTNNPGMTALKSFYDLTMIKVQAGNCGPTNLNPPA